VTEASGPNKRRHPRATPHTKLFAAWRTSARKNVARVSSVCLGGLFIREADPPPAGVTLELLFETPNGDIRARATVRTSVAGRGMGVEFTQMRQEERARLAQMLKKLLG
jgi:hypothetical protein